MASSKPIFKMLYLTLDANFGEQQAQILRNVVLYSEERCASLLKYTEKRQGKKIIFAVKTSLSPESFAAFAADKIRATNNSLIYGLWNDGSAAAICFHNLADLTDQQSWTNRTWVFDTQSDVFVSSCEADCLTRHKLNKEDLLIF